MYGAALRHAGETGTDLHALDRVDAHHGVSDVGIHLVEQRLAQADRHPAGGHPNARAARVAGLAQRVHVGLQIAHVRLRCKKRIVRYMLPTLERDHDAADLRHAPTKPRAVLLEEPLLGDRTGRDHGRRESRRRAPATPRIANAVLLPVGVIGVAGPELLRDLTVVFAALVGVLDQQRDRGAGGLALVDATQDLHRVRLAALRHVATGTGAAAVEIALDVGLGQRHAGRAAVDDATDRWAVGFTKIGDCEKGAESVAAHGRGLSTQRVQTRQAICAVQRDVHQTMPSAPAPLLQAKHHGLGGFPRSLLRWQKPLRVFPSKSLRARPRRGLDTPRE